MNYDEWELNWEFDIPTDPQDPDEEDPRMLLYNEYGDHVFEDFESYCDRMAEQFGPIWVPLLMSRRR